MNFDVKFLITVSGTVSLKPVTVSIVGAADAETALAQAKANLVTIVTTDVVRTA